MDNPILLRQLILSGGWRFFKSAHLGACLWIVNSLTQSRRNELYGAIGFTSD